ncbi:hypothetical protein CAEBREN_12210 [Caenorhabditis brenneri]|uniref:Uncharacterized protein n=1 Tax=Caenorhabditis brenneri TaxID=135651 RepID=G0M880_CAEBE|nr:hypothetical protein CAEBREN_12210 [Caenorhabditis brenneri]
MSCLVCETDAHGQHFGIRCCRACAAFFRRTLTMNLRYKCRFDRKCEVSFNKRYSCRCCRYEKCVRVGMRKDNLTSPVSVVQNKSEAEKDSSGNETDSIGHSPHSSLESYTYRPPSFDKQIQNPEPPALIGNGTYVQEVGSEAYQPNGDLHQPNFSFHRTVIEEVGRAVMPTPPQQQQHIPQHQPHISQQQQQFDYQYTDLMSTDEHNGTSMPSSSHYNGMSHEYNHESGNQNQMFAMAAQQATQDLHVNVQNVLTPTIDSLFGQPPETFCQLPDIPLTLCQQALLAYREHNRQWPDQDKMIENVPLDMENFMRNHYIEIEHIARFCMSIRVFAQLPKDQKWIIFKHFWTRFYELDRCFATCQRLGYNLSDERGLTLNGQIINFGISVVKLENISDMDATQVKNFLKGSMDKFRLIFINPFKKLQPTEYELMYMMMSIMWSVSNLPGITDATRDMSEKVELRLAEDLHTYYAEQYDNNNPNYAGRITRLSSIASAVDEITERKREDSQVSKTFNIFKNDFFFSDLTDFPV